MLKCSVHVSVLLSNCKRSITSRSLMVDTTVVLIALFAFAFLSEKADILNFHDSVNHTTQCIPVILTNLAYKANAKKV